MWTDKERDHELGVLRRILVETKGLSRREFIERLGAAAAGSAVLGALGSTLGGRAEAQQKPVTTIGWGGAWQEACNKAYFDPFTKKTGIPVKYIAPYDFAKVRAMHQAGRMELDVMEPGSVETPRAIKLGMCQPLNWKVIDRSVLSPGQLKHGDFGVGSITLSTPQGIGTASTPQFARLGLGTGAGGVAVIKTTGIFDVGLFDDGNCGAADTIDWTAGMVHKSTLTVATCTYTFGNPTAAGTWFTIEVIQDGTGGRLVTWPVTVIWEGGVAPTLSTAASTKDVCVFFYDGTSYLGRCTINT